MAAHLIIRVSLYLFFYFPPSPSTCSSSQSSFVVDSFLILKLQPHARFPLATILLHLFLAPTPPLPPPPLPLSPDSPIIVVVPRLRLNRSGKIRYFVLVESSSLERLHHRLVHLRHFGFVGERDGTSLHCLGGARGGGSKRGGRKRGGGGRKKRRRRMMRYSGLSPAPSPSTAQPTPSGQ